MRCFVSTTDAICGFARWDETSDLLVDRKADNGGFWTRNRHVMLQLL